MVQDLPCFSLSDYNTMVWSTSQQGRFSTNDQFIQRACWVCLSRFLLIQVTSFYLHTRQHRIPKNLLLFFKTTKGAINYNVPSAFLITSNACISVSSFLTEPRRWDIRCKSLGELPLYSESLLSVVEVPSESLGSIKFPLSIWVAPSTTDCVFVQKYFGPKSTVHWPFKFLSNKGDNEARYAGRDRKQKTLNPLILALVHRLTNAAMMFVSTSNISRATHVGTFSFSARDTGVGV